MTDLMFLDNSGNLLALEDYPLDEARIFAEKLSAMYQTDVTVTSFEFRVDRQYCECGESMELVSGQVACPVCDWEDLEELTEVEDDQIEESEFIQIVEGGVIRSVQRVEASLWWATQSSPQDEFWFRRPLWHYRPAVDNLMDRYNISRDVAVEMYRMKD